MSSQDHIGVAQWGWDQRLSFATKHREWVRLAVVVGAFAADIVIVRAASMVASLLRFGSVESASPANLALVVLPAYLLACVAGGAYRPDILKSGIRSVSRASMSWAVAAGFAFAAAFALQAGERLSRIETGIFLLVGWVFLVFGHLIGAQLMKLLKSVMDSTTLVFGDGSAVAEAGIEGRSLNVRSRKWRPLVHDPELLHEVFSAIKDADRVVLSFHDPNERRDWCEVMPLMGVEAESLEPALVGTSPIGIGSWSGKPTLVVARGPLTFSERIAKRSQDLLLTVCVSPLALVLVAVFAVLVKIESPGPAFFLQERVGRNNRRYLCCKLRTMRLEAQDGNGSLSAGRHDDRVTRIGRLLRRTSLDELPQLWNVLAGEMSLVGPRPHALGSTAGGVLFWDAADGY